MLNRGLDILKINLTSMEEMGKAANCASQKLNTLFKIIEAPIFALLVKGANLLSKLILRQHEQILIISLCIEQFL